MKFILLQAVKLKKGTKVAHVMAGNVLPPMSAPKLDENVPKGGPEVG